MKTNSIEKLKSFALQAKSQKFIIGGEDTTVVDPTVVDAADERKYNFFKPGKTLKEEIKKVV